MNPQEWIELFHTIREKPLSVITGVAVLLFSFRAMMLLRDIRRHQKDERMEIRQEQKLDLIMKEMGISWDGHLKKSQTEAKNCKKSLGLLRAALFIFRKGKLKMKKMKSRKFWMSVIAALLVIANEGLDLGVNSETVMAFAAIVVGYIFGESYIDAKKIDQKDEPGDHGPAVSDGEYIEK